MFFIDPLYLFLVVVPSLILSVLASCFTKMTFNKYAKESSYSGITGAEAARRLLAYAGIHDVNIEPVSGFLTDHYDPIAKTLRLSTEVYSSSSLSAIGVACHEAGHAIQHAHNYLPMYVRSLLVPVTNLSTQMANFVLIVGSIFMAMGSVLGKNLILLGAIFFSAAVIFSIITLPVEWDASTRAKKLIVDAGIVSYEEAGKAGAVLNAAFMTYVAAVVSSILTLLYFLIRAGVFNSDD